MDGNEAEAVVLRRRLYGGLLLLRSPHRRYDSRSVSPALLARANVFY